MPKIKNELYEEIDRLGAESSKLKAERLTRSEVIFLLSHLPTRAPCGPDDGWMRRRNAVAGKLNAILDGAEEAPKIPWMPWIAKRS